jgi:hypothetical protein
MGLWDENKDLVNAILVIIGIIIIFNFLIPHMVNAKALEIQVADLREEVRSLRKIILKRIT